MALAVNVTGKARKNEYLNVSFVTATSTILTQFINKFSCRSKKATTVLLTVIVISFIPYYAFSQCTDIEVLDFSNGKGMTLRMIPPDYKDFNQTMHKWENNKDNINDDFIELEKNSLSYYVKQNIAYTINIDSCAFRLKNGTPKEKSQSILNLLFNNEDTLVQLIKTTLSNENSSSVRRKIAWALMFCKTTQAIDPLKELTNDKCKFVRLQAANSLSILGEKDVSYKTLLSLWEEQDPQITMDNFPSFTSGYRNIGTTESIESLKDLCQDRNGYCALDASICLYQLGQYQACLNGLKHVLTSKNKFLFFNASILLWKYFPDDTVKDTLSEYVNDSDTAISTFAEYLLRTLYMK